MRTKHLIASGFVFVVALAGCAVPADEQRQPITIKGSDTMVQLGQRWAEVFMNGHPGSVVQVTGGGSGTGIAALINGTTQICQASRSMTEEEKVSVKTQRNADVVEAAQSNNRNGSRNRNPARGRIPPAGAAPDSHCDGW